MFQSNIEDRTFSQYVNWLKFLTAVEVVEEFSTREPIPNMLPKIFRIIGKTLCYYLVKADEAYHLFLNPDFNEAHILKCQGNEGYNEKRVSIRILLDEKDPLSWFYYKKGSIEPTDEMIKPATSDNELWNLLEQPDFYVVAPFCQQDIPYGYFIFVWRNPESTPDLFKKEGVRIREIGIKILNYLQHLLTRLLTNYYPLHRDTYLPKFMETTPRRVSILFSDIRNFTTAFEAMRLYVPGRAKSPNPLVGLVKAYLAAASQVIAQPGIGRIDKFIGDGIMATFGEYLTCKEVDGRTSEENRSLVACLLSIYSAAMLIDAFQKLFNQFLNLDIIKKFMMEYNERFDLRIGTGINFGEATFDYFGTSITSDIDSSRLIGGYLEFTAIGDNVNTAQRLESIANNPVSGVSVIERSQSRGQRSPNYVAPIIISRTVFLRITGGIRRPSDGQELPLADYYKSAIALKGKSGIVELYEINPDEIDGNYLLRTLTSVGLGWIESLIRPYWDDNKKVFQFPDERVKELIDRYCQ